MGIIGDDRRPFAQTLAAVSLGVNLDGDLALAAGRDLPRK
jgi:hypothetical protein